MYKNSCYNLLLESEDSNRIVTLCKELDIFLLGGIPSKSITEFCGAPGSGKTQMCLQLCVSVQFPKKVGGVGGHAFYIDTNQDFNPNRLKEIATHVIQRYEKTFRKVFSEPATSENSKFNIETTLNNISYAYCADYVKLLALILTLRDTSKQNDKLKLIVIDSFSFPLRTIEETKERNRIITEMLQELQNIALKYNLAVVITNELTTKHVRDKWKICPSLGDILRYKVNTRILLSQEKEQQRNIHVAMVNKCVNAMQTAIPFQIKKAGIRGLQ